MPTADDFLALTAPAIPRLHRLALRLTRDANEAADLVQEAMCRAWAAFDRFEHGGSVAAYLARIVYNTFVSRHRHTQVVSSTGARFDLVEHLFDRGRVEEAFAPEGAWHQPHLSDEVWAALQTLPEHYRRVVELVDLGGLPYKEAAELLDVPLGTVMSRLHRARRHMRGCLADYAQAHGYSAEACAAA